MQWQTHTHSSENMYIPTRMPTCHAPGLEFSPTPSHMHFPCMKKRFHNKRFLFPKTHWTISDIKIYWTTLRYNLVDNPPVPENIFLRQGEQCLIDEFSYKGYSPPKCTCNGKHTHIQVKICTFLLECLHVMPQVSSSRQLPHTCIFHV